MAVKLTYDELKEKSQLLRGDLLAMLFKAGSGHPGGVVNVTGDSTATITAIRMTHRIEAVSNLYIR